MNKQDGKVKLVLLIIALGIGWFGAYLTTTQHPEMGIFLLFASLTSLTRLPAEVASRALALLALGTWYIAFPQKGQEGQEILLPLLTGGTAFLFVLLLREIVGTLLQAGEGGKESRQEGRERAK